MRKEPPEEEGTAELSRALLVCSNREKNLMARNGKKETQKQKSLPFIQPDAAGIDIGATEIYVAVPEERDNRSVRKFATFTEELHRLADWLMACSIKTVAIESTGV